MPESGSPSRELCEVLLDSGRTFLKGGQLEQARRALQQALAVASEHGLRDERRTALALLGRMHLSGGQVTEALALLEECAALLEPSGSDAQGADVLSDLAEAFRRSNRLEEAERAARESLLRSSGIAPGRPRARGLEELAMALRLGGRIDQAIDHLHEVIRIHESLEDHRGIARALTGLGNALQKQGRLQDSLEHHQRARALFEECGDREGLGKACNNVGGLLLIIGNLVGADENFERALEVFRELGQEEPVSAVAFNLGLLASYRGMGEKAEARFRESLRILEARGDKARAASALNNLAQVAHMAGKHEEAVEHARAALALREALGLPGLDPSFARPWYQLGVSLLELDRQSDAAAACASLQRIAAAAGSDELRAEALLLQASLLLREGDAHSALSLAREAGGCAKRASTARAEGEALRLEGEAHLKLGSLDAARETLLAGETLLRGLQSPDLLANVRFTLGRLFAEAGALEAAAERLRRAAEAFTSMGNLRLAFRSQLALGETEWRLDPAQARETLLGARKMAARIDELAEREAADCLAKLEDRNGSVNAALLLELHRRLRALSDPSAVVRAMMDWCLELPSLARAALAPLADGTPDLSRAVAAGSDSSPEAWTELAREAIRTGRPEIRHGAEAARVGAVPLFTFGPRPTWVLLVLMRDKSDGVDRDDWSSILVGAAMVSLALRTPQDGGSTAAASGQPQPETGSLANAAETAATVSTFGGLVGGSDSMRKIFHTIERVAPSAASVLIEGESGTGKELVARAIHDRSDRRSAPFVAINCPSIPRDLMEAELFGHERGAFTGAHAARLGQIDAAEGGSLFLDEVGDMEPSVQAKLLRFLQEREFLRVGGRVPVRVDVRLIAATSRNLEQDIKAGRFREDLYYRINVAPITMPALRERADDVPLLADHIARGFAERAIRFAPEAKEALARYGWPGNVRELRNLIEFMTSLHPAETITLAQLPEKIQRAARTNREETPALRRGESLDARMMGVEGALLRAALEQSAGNQSEAARALGMTESRLRLRLRKYGLGAAESTAAAPKRTPSPRTKRS